MSLSFLIFHNLDNFEESGTLQRVSFDFDSSDVLSAYSFWPSSFTNKNLSYRHISTCEVNNLRGYSRKHFYNSKTLEISWCPSGRNWLNSLWYIHIMEHIPKTKILLQLFLKNRLRKFRSLRNVKWKGKIQNSIDNMLSTVYKRGKLMYICISS